MLNKLTKIAQLFISIIVFNIICPAESLAIVTKSIGGVEYKKYSEKAYLPKLNLGSELFNEDVIKTNSNGFVKFSYLDDGTTIKIHKNSELFVRGDITESLISKRINISNGTYNFDISKQENEEFTIITPTSVASVKGTKFILVAGKDGGDEFFGFDGVVEVLNKESNVTLRLTSNIKVTSLPTGEINSEIMTQSDYNVTNQIIQIENEIDSEEIIPEDDSESDTQEETDLEESSSPAQQEVNEVRIKIRNADGEEKELIIRYNE